MGHSNELRLTEAKAVFRLLLDIQDLRHDPVRCQQHMVDRLCRLIGAKRGVAIQLAGYLPRRKIDVRGYVEGGDGAPETSALWAAWGSKGRITEDPMVEVTLPQPDTVVAAVRHELVTDQDWHSSVFYRECAGPAGIRDVLVSFFRMEDPGQTFGIALHRDHSDALFQPRQKRMLRLFIEEYHRLYQQGQLPYLNPPPGGPNPGESALALSPRQQQLLARLLAGDTPKTIAFDLNLSVHTVRTYIRDLYKRLNVTGRAELMARYRQAHDHGSSP